MLHSSVRVKYGAISSCWRGLTERSERFQAGSTAKASVSQRMPCLAACFSPGWEVSSCDSITGFPWGLPSCSLLPTCLLLCYLLSPLVFVLLALGFFVALLLGLFVCCLFSLFKATHYSSSIFKKRKTMFTDLNFGN